MGRAEPQCKRLTLGVIRVGVDFIRNSCIVRVERNPTRYICIKLQLKYMSSGKVFTSFPSTFIRL